MPLKVLRLRTVLLNISYKVWAIVAVLIALGITNTVSDLRLPDEEVFSRIRAKAPWELAYQIAMTGAFTALAVWRWRAEKRIRRKEGGLCETCGYDLRASVERCPECGATLHRGDPAAR
jgi:hypothetical protein